MTPVPTAQETAAGKHAAATVPVGRTRTTGQMLRSQANAPCL